MNSRSKVRGWLRQAGLERYTVLAELSEEAFRSLLMQVHLLQVSVAWVKHVGWSNRLCPSQDYGKHGVTDMEDKQKLFRLIKKLAQPDSAVDQAKPLHNISPVLQVNHGADLLDLNDIDENLIEIVRCICNLKGSGISLSPSSLAE